MVTFDRIKLHVTAISVESIAAHAIQHYIKKSTLHFEQKTSANNGIDYFGGSF